MINWINVNEKHPPFKKIVLGCRLPNAVELVKLEKIDETGPVFTEAKSMNLLDILEMKSSIKIDFWAEIDLPVTEKSGK